MSGVVLVPVTQYRLRTVTLVGQSTEDYELQVSNIKIGGNLSFQTHNVRVQLVDVVASFTGAKSGSLFL